MRFTALAIVALWAAMLPAAPAAAQREAVSSGLSPDAAAAAFSEAVLEACVPAIVDQTGVKGLAQAAKAKLSPTNDIATRAQAGAAADETVWDVAGAKGVVTVHERAGRCAVSVYGPPAMATIMAVAQKLAASAGFERLAGASPPGGVVQSLMKTAGARRVMVQLGGSEPGSPGHQSRFSVVTATVFAAP
jgi:hypothetical protein